MAVAALAPARPVVPVRINLDQGLPDPDLFPRAALADAAVEAVRDDATLRYFGAGGPGEMQRGHEGLRTRIATRLAARDGRHLDSSGIVLVNGSTDGLALCVNALLDPGDVAVVEAPTYPFARRFLEQAAVTIVTVPVDREGMVVSALDDVIVRATAIGPVRLIYTIPTFHAPTGTVLPLERRRRLLDVAAHRGVPVLEDNCYYEFSYGEAPPPTLRSLDTEGLVLQSDSFSKTIAPGLRVGFLAGAPAAMDLIARVRQDFGPSRLATVTVEKFLAGGGYDAHLATLRDAYRAKLDATCDALDRCCRPWLRFERPGGGFYIWAAIDPAVDWSRARSRLAEEGVAVRSGDVYAVDDRPVDWVRLSPIQVPIAELGDGIAALGRALADAAR